MTVVGFGAAVVEDLAGFVGVFASSAEVASLAFAVVVAARVVLGVADTEVEKGIAVDDGLVVARTAVVGVLAVGCSLVETFAVAVAADKDVVCFGCNLAEVFVASASASVAGSVEGTVGVWAVADTATERCPEDTAAEFAVLVVEDIVAWYVVAAAEGFAVEDIADASVARCIAVAVAIADFAAVGSSAAFFGLVEDSTVPAASAVAALRLVAAVAEGNLVVSKDTASACAFDRCLRPLSALTQQTVNIVLDCRFYTD